jgi:hypothetical protein
MAADLLKIKRMLPTGSVPDDKIQQAIEDAPAYLRKYGVAPSDCDYDLMERLIICHILYTLGFSRVVLSKAVGDVSVSWSDFPVNNQNGMSPYLYTFIGMLQTSDFAISP